MKKTPKVLYLYADKDEKEYNCSHWRSYLPSTYLRRFSGWQTKILPLETLGDKETNKYLSISDIVIVERLLSAEMINTFLALMAHGKKIVFDMDDSYKHLPITSEAYKYWISGIMIKGEKKQVQITYPPIQQVGWYSKLVNAISSPSKLILEDWKEHNDNLLWIPNFVDADLYQQIPLRKEKLTIGWGGGATHYDSFYNSGLMTALRRIYEKNKGKINIEFITADEILAHKMRDIKAVVYKVDRLLYPKTVQDLDIALAPLAGEYDRRRSWLKIAEYSMCGIPWIASNYDPYIEYQVPGSILVKNSPENWELAIQGMIDNYKEYYNLAQKSVPFWKAAFSIQENHKFLSEQYLKVM